MKAIFALTIGLAFFSLPAWPQKQEDSGPCGKTLIFSQGSLISSQSSMSTIDQILCSVSATTHTSSGDQRMTFEPGGLVHVSQDQTRSSDIHTFAFVGSNPNQNHLTSDTKNSQVTQGALKWNFQNDGVSLQSIQTLDGKSDCLSKSKLKNASTVKLSSSAGFDLNACSGVVVMDLGSAITDDKNRQTPALKRDRMATLSVAAGGKVSKCQIQIGRLFEYQKVQDAAGPVKILQKGYDPCYMYAVPKAPQLTPTEAIRQFKQQNPGHSCISMQHVDANSVSNSFQTIADGMTELSGDLSISYRLHPPSELAQNIKDYGKEPGCSKVAASILATDGGTSGVGSSDGGRH